VKELCLPSFSKEELDQIRAAGKNVDLAVARDDAERRRLIADAEATIGVPAPELLKAARKLRWVQHLAAGVDEVNKETLAHPCVVTNMQRVYAPVIAETALALLLALTRGLVQEAIPNMRARRWARFATPLEDLHGKTMGVVGMGGIGSEIARRAHHGFEMRVVGTDAKPLARPDFVEDLRDPGWLPEMASQVDVLVSAAPATRETAKVFNEALFRRMKKSAYFINVSRGALVDQPALIKALKEGWIRGAGLDVTTPEPLPADSPLWEMQNVVITPHNSGQAPIRQKRMIALVAENVRRYTHGLPLMNVVDKARGY
jgi:phosphoglycerate dehydrogenase-like enzyme